MAGTGMAALMLGALGVVYGDIGTSPLYSLQAVFAVDHHAVHATRGEVYGVISLVFWSITMIVSVGYVTFIMRADDHGEGGIMSLTALLRGTRVKRTAMTAALVTLGILGASLFFGDSAITPAISVLSAVEGVKVAVPSLGSVVLPIAAVVLGALFALQRFGTGFVGNLFGPVMALWFGVLALIGGVEVAYHPDILQALSPTYGAQFLIDHGTVAFIALGAVVLAVTGAEALYADMGHFGRAPIRRSWFVLVFPALTLNYLAQGSLILRSPKAVANPFFLLFPGWAQIPMVFLATFATVIASQSVISGAFSVAQQAVQLGFLPRITIRHTSARQIGRIYVPAINSIMFVAVLAIVIGFGSSAALASAYGVAVTGTFILTTILFLGVARLLWHQPWRWIVVGGAVFLTVEVAFFAANLTKVAHGGWLTLGIATVVFTLLMTWRKGRAIVTANRGRGEPSLPDFLEGLGAEGIGLRHVPGVGVFLNPNPRVTPFALRANVERNRILHDHVLIVSVDIARVSHVPDAERVLAEERILFSGATGDPLNLGAEVAAITLRFGFLDEPDVPAALRRAADSHLIEGEPDIADATYFLSQSRIVPTSSSDMATWRKRVFVTIAHNATDPAEYFRLPDNHTVTMSCRIPL